MISMSWQICVDTGGTFTDCIAIDPSGCSRNLKVLSTGVLRVRVNVATGTKIRIYLPLALATSFLKGFRIKIGREIRTVVDFDSSQNELTVDRRFNRTASENIAEIYTGEEVP